MPAETRAWLAVIRSGSVATKCFNDVAEALEDSPVPEAVAIVDESEGIMLIEVGIGDLSCVADPASESRVIEDIDHGPCRVGKAKSSPVVPLGLGSPAQGGFGRLGDQVGVVKEPIPKYSLLAMLISNQHAGASAGQARREAPWHSAH